LGQTLRIVQQIQTMETLGQARREQYATMLRIAAATGLRIGELLALRLVPPEFRLCRERPCLLMRVSIRERTTVGL